MITLNARRNPLRLDPTRTTVLRRAMITDLRRRFQELKREQVTAPGAISRGIGGWEGYWARYTQQAFLRGLERSWLDARKGMLVPPKERDMLRRDFLAGLQSQVYEQTQELSGRVFSELQNVAQDTATRIARVRADGKAKRLSQGEIERQIKQVYDIGSRRVETIARTEIIRAHAQGQLLAFERLGVKQIGILVEWRFSGLGTTAKGNPSPCPECKQYAGMVMTLEEAQGLIPLHPNCLCSYAPVAATREEYQEEFTNNAFCPTGPGGGIDPSCSPHGLSPVKLSAADEKVLAAYQDNSYDINGWLREGIGNAPEAIQRQVTQFRKVFEKNAVVLKKPIVVYRGLDEELPPGDFQDKAFVSTSTSRKSAAFFGDNVMELHVQAGVKVLPILGGREQEILLPQWKFFTKKDNLKYTVNQWRADERSPNPY